MRFRSHTGSQVCLSLARCSTSLRRFSSRLGMDLADKVLSRERPSNGAANLTLRRRRCLALTAGTSPSVVSPWVPGCPFHLPLCTRAWARPRFPVVFQDGAPALLFVRSLAQRVLSRSIAHVTCCSWSTLLRSRSSCEGRVCGVSCLLSFSGSSGIVCAVPMVGIFIFAGTFFLIELFYCSFKGCMGVL